jgi:hypothetical protein
MGVTGGIFNIIQRGQIHATAASLRAHIQSTASQSAKNATANSTNPLNWSLKRGESAAASFWRLAPESAAKNAPTLATIKRLEDMADDDNRDISAEKMRQAKVKLDGLRRQLQMLAATGDVRQLRRIAAEAASLAREIGVAARSIAQGIGAGNVPSDTGSAQATASAANAAAQTTSSNTAASNDVAPDSGGSDKAETGNPTTTVSGDQGTTLAQSYTALHQLVGDARNAILQAKGIIAQAAQIARAKRRGSDDDEDRYFRELQAVVDDALDNVDAGQREALGQLLSPSDAGDAGGSESVFASTSLDITVETIAISDTRVEVFA